MSWIVAAPDATSEARTGCSRSSTRLAPRAPPTVSPHTPPSSAPSHSLLLFASASCFSDQGARRARSRRRRFAQALALHGGIGQSDLLGR
jgi:hypothetical protein